VVTLEISLAVLGEIIDRGGSIEFSYFDIGSAGCAEFVA
jgi:hypothetical protein